jgi:NADH dehydrogenase [ubiquinone] 1 alpha subcomplex assembly factor 7
MSLLERIYEQIEQEGGLTIAEYMQHALADPEEGYYMTRDPFGLEGDFVTAPELSQIFGEMLGVWMAECWQMQGKPKADVVEFGPGLGTLMEDFLRATRHVEGFHDAIDVHLVESSPNLSEHQQRRLAGKHARLHWHRRLPLLERPQFVLGNEFFDALPIEQFIAGSKGFHRRLVVGDRKKGLRFDQTEGQFRKLPARWPRVEAQSLEAGTIIETCPQAQEIMERLASGIARFGGAALFIDYGYVRPEDGVHYAAGDTLQAVRKHQPHEVLDAPGTADLTAHVDFSTLADVAVAAGGYAAPIITQGEFLQRMGGELRLKQLCDKAHTPPVCERLIKAYHRLTDGQEMGDLFKVLAVMPAGIPAPLFTAPKEGI